jgi:hypothetical protein
MLAFEVFIDGERIYVAGVEDCAVLTALISATFRRPHSGTAGEIEFSAGGLMQSDAGGASYHMRWEPRQLQVGSQVTINVIETEQVDEPLRRYRSDRQVQESPWTDQEIEKFEREEWVRLKTQFERDNEEGA